MTSRLCLTLTGNSIEENLKILSENKEYADMCELRVDFLNATEIEKISEFPELCGMPCILTIRREIDGGKWVLSEEERAIFFEKILESQKVKQTRFAFVDFEEDFRVESIENLARELKIRIIRSVHDFKNPVLDIEGKIASLNCKGDDIPKIAFMPGCLRDVTNLFNKAKNLKGDHILLAMGRFGIPSRILAAKLGNYLTFTSVVTPGANIQTLSHIPPEEMCNLYNFKNLTEKSVVYGITGFPLEVTSSPALHNEGYRKHNIDAVYIPVRSDTIEETLEFNEAVGVMGMSVTIPHKESVMKHLKWMSPEVQEIGACNTIVREADGWHGYNTDAPGFSKALLSFAGLDNLKGKKVSIIGAGGAACAVIYAVKKLGAEACIFNRTVEKAKALAEKYGFDHSVLDSSSSDKIKDFSDIIVQTTSKGMGANAESNETNDPIWFYDFNGSEKIYDIVYHPATTPVMARGQKAGCSVENGFNMLRYQGYEQFVLFTGVNY